VAVFVHGCFWHRHDCAFGRKEPKTNKKFWADKFAANVRRDRRAARRLRAMGWRVLTAWECRLRRDPEAFKGRLRRAL
jgi:DNA mismatch endonuclease (patch repair protein)